MAKLLFTPYGFTATTTLQMLIREAYGVQDNQIAGAPNWLNSEKYDIEARMEKSVAAELHKLSADQRTLEQTPLRAVHGSHSQSNAATPGIVHRQGCE
jgi:uncharacterized protein (TIGR03435 family)